MKGMNMAKLRCKQAVVYKQKETLHTAFGRNIIPESINTQRDSIVRRGLRVNACVYFFELLSPSNSRHLACAGRKTTVRGPASKHWHELWYVWWKLWARLYLCLRVFTCVCANLMPAQCVSRQPQIAVRAGVRLIRHLLVSLPPAGPLAAPQGATCGVGGPGYAKVRPGVCLVVHSLSTRGQWWQRIWVLLQHSNRGGGTV